MKKKFLDFYSNLTLLLKQIDIRDILIFGGLISLSYGSYELYPWLGFVVLGAVSMLLGLGWLLRRPDR